MSPAACAENFSEARDDTGSNLLQYALSLQTTVEQRHNDNARRYLREPKEERMAIENRSIDERDTLSESRPPATLRRPRTTRWFILIFLLVLTLGLGGYFGVQWWLYALHHVYTDDARVKGTLITISSEVAGRLVILAVEEGQLINKGDRLAQIQQDEYQAQVALHSAAL